MTADHQYALSVVYNCQRIVRCPSGAFALFSAWDPDDGLRLEAIGTLAELAPLITEAPKPAPKVKLDLMALLRPKTLPFQRRL